MIMRIHDQALDMPDTAVRGFDPVAAPHLDFAQRDPVVGDGRDNPASPRYTPPGIPAPALRP